MEVIFTKAEETADERIEKLAQELINIRTQVYVATSDYTEQWTVFGQGALRISARELLVEVESVNKEIKKELKENQEKIPLTKIPLSREIAEIFEKWRRGN